MNCRPHCRQRNRREHWLLRSGRSATAAELHPIHRIPVAPPHAWRPIPEHAHAAQTRWHERDITVQRNLKKFRQVTIYHELIALDEMGLRYPLVCGAARPEAIALLTESRVLRPQCRKQAWSPALVIDLEDQSWLILLALFLLLRLFRELL